MELLRISFTPAEPNAEYTVILKHKHGTEEHISGVHNGGMVMFIQKTYVGISFIAISLPEQRNDSYVQLETEETKIQIRTKRFLRKTVETEEVPLTLGRDVGDEYKLSFPTSE